MKSGCIEDGVKGCIDYEVRYGAKRNGKNGKRQRDGRKRKGYAGAEVRLRVF